MPNIKIKQMDERIATQGVHFGLGDACRKLEPGEVVTVPKGELFDGIWDTGRVELTPEDPTRPLMYENANEARYCSPSFNPRDPGEERDSQLARAAVAERLANESAVKDPEPEPEPVADIKPPKKKAAKPNRRQAARQRQHGTETATG